MRRSPRWWRPSRNPGAICCSVVEYGIDGRGGSWMVVASTIFVCLSVSVCQHVCFCPSPSLSLSLSQSMPCCLSVCMSIGLLVCAFRRSHIGGCMWDKCAGRPSEQGSRPYTGSRAQGPFAQSRLACPGGPHTLVAQRAACGVAGRCDTCDRTSNTNRAYPFAGKRGPRGPTAAQASLIRGGLRARLHELGRVLRDHPRGEHVLELREEARMRPE